MRALQGTVLSNALAEIVKERKAHIEGLLNQTGSTPSLGVLPARFRIGEICGEGPRL